jgi:hypothetical protein
LVRSTKAKQTIVVTSITVKNVKLVKINFLDIQILL